MDLLFFLLIGFALGYWVRSLKKSHPTQTSKRQFSQPLTHQQRLQFKSHHQTESDRIRELNKLSTNQSVFLRLLKQTFLDYEIAIKQKRFIVLDRDQMPCAIFEYRDGTQAMKLSDKEDGLPLYLYKGLISAEEIKQDYLNITSTKNSPV